MLNREDLDSLRADFEAFKEKNTLCEDGSWCEWWEYRFKGIIQIIQDGLYDYIYGHHLRVWVYISRWGFKGDSRGCWESLWAITLGVGMFELLDGHMVLGLREDWKLGL